MLRLNPDGTASLRADFFSGLTRKQHSNSALTKCLQRANTGSEPGDSLGRGYEPTKRLETGRLSETPGFRSTRHGARAGSRLLVSDLIAEVRPTELWSAG
jgi:hypothetical protein